MWLLWFITICWFECCGLQFILDQLTIKRRITYNNNNKACQSQASWCRQKENYILSLKFLMFDRVQTIGRWKALRL
jgi:hypothetical protein